MRIIVKNPFVIRAIERRLRTPKILTILYYRTSLVCHFCVERSTGIWPAVFSLAGESVPSFIWLPDGHYENVRFFCPEAALFKRHSDSTVNARLIVRCIISIMCAVAFVCGTSHAIVYVDREAIGPMHDGTSWSAAFNSISDGLKAAKSGDSVWVKFGTYHEKLMLDNDIKLYGGFIGTEVSPQQRIMSAFPSTIDAGNGGGVIEVGRYVRATIDGFNIQRGSAARGGGIYCSTDSIVNISNCRIEKCHAAQYGGGVYYGTYTQGEMSGCVLSFNSAPNGGGAVVEYHSYPTINGCLFVKNSADTSGGGLYCPFHSGAYLENCTLALNNAGASGGAVYAYQGGPVTLKSCIIAFNSAPAGGGLFGGGSSSQASFSHCDLYSNIGGDLGGVMSAQPDYAANFSADPLFLLPEYDEFHLQPTSPSIGIGAFAGEVVPRIGAIGIAKHLPDGMHVELSGKIVSGVDGDITYIQDVNRCAAIAVRNMPACSAGDVVSSLTGVLSTSGDGNRLFTAQSCSITGKQPNIIRPIGVRISWLATRRGISVRTWGKLQRAGDGTYFICDGESIVPILISGLNATDGDFIIADGFFTERNTFIGNSSISTAQSAL